MLSVVYSCCRAVGLLNVFRMERGHCSCRLVPSPLGASRNRGNLFSLARLSSHTDTLFVLLIAVLFLSLFSSYLFLSLSLTVSLSFYLSVFLSVSLFSGSSGWSPCGTPCRVPNLFIISALCRDARGMLKYKPLRSGYKWASVPASPQPTNIATHRPVGRALLLAATTAPDKGQHLRTQRHTHAYTHGRTRAYAHTLTQIYR